MRRIKPALRTAAVFALWLLFVIAFAFPAMVLWMFLVTLPVMLWSTFSGDGMADREWGCPTFLCAWLHKRIIALDGRY